MLSPLTKCIFLHFPIKYLLLNSFKYLSLSWMSRKMSPILEDRGLNVGLKIFIRCSEKEMLFNSFQGIDWYILCSFLFLLCRKIMWFGRKWKPGLTRQRMSLEIEADSNGFKPLPCMFSTRIGVQSRVYHIILLIVFWFGPGLFIDFPVFLHLSNHMELFQTVFNSR